MTTQTLPTGSIPATSLADRRAQLREWRLNEHSMPAKEFLHTALAAGYRQSEIMLAIDDLRRLGLED